MGTKVQRESCFPGYFSMRDVNEDSNSCSWSLQYGDRAFTNGRYYNGFLPREIADVYPGYDRDIVKQTMLEHEAIFKNQLCELHRLYRIQRDLMDEVKRKELYKNRMPSSLSSSPFASQITSEDARKWHIPSFPLANFVCAGPSTSGIYEMHSPLSSMKGSSGIASPLLSQNGGTSKGVEIMDPRPTKVRRKMFDLQLPADGYIDTEEGEQLRDGNVCIISSYLPNRNGKVAPESGTNLLIGTGGKNNCQEDALQSESCFKSESNLADLNEPIEIVDAKATANDIRGCTSSHYGIQGHELAAKPKSQLHGLPKEILVNSHHRSNNGTVTDLHLQNNVDGKLWFPRLLDLGNNKNNLKYATQGLQPEKLTSSSQPIQVLLKKSNEPPTLTDQSKVDKLRERNVCGSEFSGRNEVSTNNHPGSIAASYVHSQYALDPSSNFNNSWSHLISSREKTNGSLSHKSMSSQIHPYLNCSATLSKSTPSSTQSRVIFGDGWHCNRNSASNLRVGSYTPKQNESYHVSSSESKEPHIPIPSGNSDYLNCSSASNVAPENFMNHSSAKFYESSNCLEAEPVKDLNLNIAFTNSSSTKMVSRQGVEVIDLERNHEDHLVTLPWLRTKPNHKYEATSIGVDLNTVGLNDLQSSPSQLSDKSEVGKFPIHTVVPNMKSGSCSSFVEGSRIQTNDSSSCRKILGCPIFEKLHIPKIESLFLTSPSRSPIQPPEKVENNRKSRELDINLPCDPAGLDCCQQIATEVVLIEKESDTQVSNVRHEIDLNSCVTEDEPPLMVTVPGSDVKIISGIDLEAPAVPDTEEDVIPGEECTEKAHEAPPLLSSRHNVESAPNEFVITAAEAIVAISLTSHPNHHDDVTCSSSEASMTDPLHWFAELASSFREDLESKYAVLRAENGRDNEGSSSEDDFESMTLRLAETKEEDYMPMPLVPENLKLEETGKNLLPTRTRKGQARRGRRRRDFQRDILPGLASLSRHEVTKDLQTFGGVMRATGHLWHSGLTRRSSTRTGCARGRRRAAISSSPAVIATPPCTPLIQQLNNVDVGLEDRRLTGWGKTTRRPRRLRCPSGNPPVIPIT